MAGSRSAETDKIFAAKSQHDLILELRISVNHVSERFDSLCFAAYFELR